MHLPDDRELRRQLSLAFQEETVKGDVHIPGRWQRLPTRCYRLGILVFGRVDPAERRRTHRPYQIHARNRSVPARNRCRVSLVALQGAKEREVAQALDERCKLERMTSSRPRASELREPICSPFAP